MNYKYQGFLFDLNGTMIDDMNYHVKAWYDVLNNDLHAGLSWEEVRSHMYGKNQELLVRVFGESHFSQEEMDRLSLEKEKKYQLAFQPHLRLINGLATFLDKSFELKIKMAIGSAAIPFNIDFVLDGLKLRKYFTAIISADDVKISKPDPETYLKAASALQLQPSSCLVFEDAPKGVEAAQNAGMHSIVITSMHTKAEFNNHQDVVGFVSDYNDPLLHELLRKHDSGD